MYYTAEGLRELTIREVLEGKNKIIHNALLIAENQAKLGYFNANIPFEMTSGEVKFLEGLGYKLEKRVDTVIYESGSKEEVNYLIKW